MNRRELQDAVTRLLDGQSLTSEELDALDEALKSLSEQEVESVSQDMQTNDLLRAIHFGDADSTPDSTERFVEQLKRRIAPPIVPTAPPIVPKAPPIETTRSTDTESEVRLLAELRSDPLPEDPTPRARRRRLARWGAVASAAAILLVLITAVALQSGGNDVDEIAARESLDDPSSDQAATAKGSMSDELVPDELVPVEAVVVARPDEVVPAPQSSETDRSVGQSDVANADVEPPSEEMASEPKFAEASTQPGSTQPGSQNIAVVTDSDSARWRDGMAPGKDVVAGPLSLVSGVARLKLAKGTEITLEGPVDLELVDENRVTLQAGRLEAFVPAGAVGFEVQTPGATVVDLGTRFGVHALPEEKLTRVDVVEGVVEVIQPVGRRVNRERKFKLTKGRTKWLSYDGLSAWDWQLVVQHGDPVADPNRLSIDGQPFDVGRPDQAALAMRQLALKFDEANQLISALPRGQRFSGRLVVDDKSQKLASARSLKLAQAELLQGIQKRWTNSIFNQVFSQGMSVEMREFFKGNGISIPGSKP